MVYNNTQMFETQYRAVFQVASTFHAQMLTGALLSTEIDAFDRVYTTLPLKTRLLQN